MDLSVTWTQFDFIMEGHRGSNGMSIAWGTHPTWEWIHAELGGSTAMGIQMALARGETIRLALLPSRGRR